MIEPRISIAMATYNGERYLKEQLDSIAAQEYLPYELVVSDDGSTDRTIDILECFAEVAPFPVRLYRNESNLGFGSNFLRAARECRGDWIAFCDQDDVWLPTKLRESADAIERTPDAVLILQNAELCSGDLTPMGRLFPNTVKPGIYGARSQHCFWLWFGFLETMSRVLLDLDTFSRPLHRNRDVNATTHDWWACTIANAIGKIVVLGEVSALYRRHGTALTGGHKDRSFAEKLRQSRVVAALQYERLHEVAESHSQYLRRVARETEHEEWRGGLRALAKDFDRFAEIQARRASLYRSGGFLGRIQNYLSIWSRGGYVGPATVALGLSSAAKDLMQSVSGRWSEDR